jgi:hypothetical protein
MEYCVITDDQVTFKIVCEILDVLEKLDICDRHHGIYDVEAIYRIHDNIDGSTDE